MHFTAFFFSRPSELSTSKKGERLNSVNDQPFQLTLASLCQPTLAKWVLSELYRGQEKSDGNS